MKMFAMLHGQQRHGLCHLIQLLPRPNIKYVKLNTFNPYTAEPQSIILAEDLINSWFKAEGETAEMVYTTDQKIIPYRISSHYKGDELTFIRYEQLLPYAQPEEGDAFRVIKGDFVTTSDGTGIVHIAPSFGADDRRVAQQNGIGSLTLVDKQGKFTEEAGLLQVGMSRIIKTKVMTIRMWMLI
jgi:isoleucyl-tRNA synthetase